MFWPYSPTCGSGTKLTLPDVDTRPIQTESHRMDGFCAFRTAYVPQFTRVVNLQEKQVEFWNCQTGPAPSESLDWSF